ncbi:hypothetical protein Gogos_007283 [Gossypium gossypioides]|uniref:Reverse transcriptase zinc-binding domain-containing protein n=1 Tax=Gossypium gossypioides TaxID=34282 RepID=A0A7J9C894_GOSGO|nr:hypothetical protein [Gossypium gossypioides]
MSPYQLGTCKERYWTRYVMPVYGHVAEDILLVLQDRSATKEVWEQVVPMSQPTSFFNSNLLDWLVSNLESHKFVASTKVHWASLFSLIGWRIWKNRNLYVFQGLSWKATEIVKVSMFCLSKGCGAKPFGEWVVGLIIRWGLARFFTLNNGIFWTGYAPTRPRLGQAFDSY